MMPTTGGLFRVRSDNFEGLSSDLRITYVGLEDVITGDDDTPVV